MVLMVLTKLWTLLETTHKVCECRNVFQYYAHYLDTSCGRTTYHELLTPLKLSFIYSCLSTSSFAHTPPYFHNSCSYLDNTEGD